MYIVVDGIDGSGKSTIVDAMRSWAEEQGKSFFDLVSWCKQNNALPNFADARDADVLFTAEPTYAWIGAAMRKEMFLSDDPYTPTEFAHAFSLDRLLLYKRLILPARAAGKLIIQDRSVSTSIIYQAAEENGPSLEEVMDLPGNALALQHAPDHLILADVEPEVALERVAGRAGEKPEDVFETIEQLKRFDERFRSDWFKQIYEERGTTIHWLNTKNGINTSIENARQLISSIIT